MPIKTKDCTIYWICPEQRLFACDYGLFSWHQAHEITVQGICREGTLAECLMNATSTKVCMSEDGTTVQMMFADFDDGSMYFEVIPHSILGSIVPAPK
jgi:hypothetical protein